MIPASVLATVLVVCTLMLLGLLTVMSLWDIDLMVSYRLYEREQQRANLESGFVLYMDDSTLMERLDESRGVKLYEGDSSSRVQFFRERWGLYEVVTMTTKEGVQESRLIGRARESFHGANLYIPENNKALSLTGKSTVEGVLRISRNGIAYTQILSEFFSGIPLRQEQITRGAEKFPDVMVETEEVIERLFLIDDFSSLLSRIPVHRAFTDSLLCFQASEYLSGMNVSGKVILYSTGSVFVEQDNCFKDVILVASKVEIADGFRGNMQVFAKDSILLGDDVILSPGSGLWIGGECPDRLIRLGEHCEVNGFVIVSGGEEEKGEVPSANYFQPATSKVRGLVYVDGVAEVHGFVTGCLYVRDCFYFAPEGYYSSILYNITLLTHSSVSFPFWMDGPYERREIKWLD